MNKLVKQEIEKLIEKSNIGCSVEEFKDKVDWNRISQYQNLSEDFIREFRDKVHWNNISYRQKLSPEFIYEFQDRLDMDHLFENNKITEKQLKLVEQEINQIKYENLVGNSNNRFEILDLWNIKQEIK